MKERNEMGVCGLKSSQDVQHQNHENLNLEDTDGIIRDTSVITYTVQNLNHKYKTPLHHLHFPGDKIGRKIPLIYILRRDQKLLGGFFIFICFLSWTSK